MNKEAKHPETPKIRRKAEESKERARSAAEEANKAKEAEAKARKEAEQARERAERAVEQVKAAREAETRARKEIPEAKERARRAAEEARSATVAEATAKKRAEQAAKARAKREAEEARVRAQREAEEAKEAAQAVTSEVYSGVIRLMIVSPADYERVKNLEESLGRVKNLRVVLVGGSAREGTRIVVSAEEPVPLLSVLSEMPPVEQAVKKGNDIQITLKDED